MMNSNYNVHTKPLFKDLGDALIWKYRLASVGITIIKIRRYHDYLFFIMEIQDLERPSLYWDGAMGVMMVHIYIYNIYFTYNVWHCGTDSLRINGPLYTMRPESTIRFLYILFDNFIDFVNWITGDKFQLTLDKMHHFSYWKFDLRMPSEETWPFYLGLLLFIICYFWFQHI